MSQAKNPESLLIDLENLQQMLDDPKREESALTLDDILNMDDNGEANSGAAAPASMLKAVNNQKKVPPSTPSSAKINANSNNPYLPNETLSRLAYERKAAADTAANALNVMAKVAEQKERQQQMKNSESRLNRLEKQRIVDELVDEMLPAIEARLRARLARLLD